MNSASTFGEALLRIAPTEIHIPTRLGLFFPDKAAALGKLMAIHGQRTPITVRKSGKGTDQLWTLVTGMHRLNGAIAEGLDFVFALERIGGTAADALDEEASENLDRRDQPPLERAIFIHATCEAAKARLAAMHGTDNQRVIAGRARQNSAADTMSAARWAKVKLGEIRADQALQEESDDARDTMSLAYGWQESVAEAFGRDVRSIRRALTLYRLVIEPFPDFTQALSDHPIVGNNAAQLKALADIKDEKQRRTVIEALLADSELSADEARVQAGIDHAGAQATPLAHQKFYNQIEGGWQRLNLGQRRQFIPNIAAMMHTPELKRELRDQLNKELGVSPAAQALAAQPSGEAGQLKPAVMIRASVKPDYIVSLEDGTRHRNLTNHLNRIGMTPAEYRQRWSLPRDYPMLAPNYTMARRKAWRDRVNAARAAMKQETADAR